MNYIFLFFILLTLSHQALAASQNPIRFWPKDKLPLELKLSADFSNEEILAIQSISTGWNTIFEGQFTLFSINETTTNKDYSNVSDYQDTEFGVYKSYHWPADFPPGALAITQISGVRKNEGTPDEYLEISHADVILNYSRKDFIFSTDHHAGTFDLKTVVLH